MKMGGISRHASMHCFLNYGKKGHPIKTFAMSQIVMDDMKDDISELKER